MKREVSADVFREKTKTRLKEMIFETSIKYLITRGTTQIVPLLRNTTSDSSKSYSLTQNHGNAYFFLFGIPAQKGYIRTHITDSHLPSALWRHWRTSACLPHSLCFGLQHIKIHLSIVFKNIFLQYYLLQIFTTECCFLQTQGSFIVLNTIFLTNTQWN